MIQTATQNGWKETTLGEVAKIIGGFAFRGEDFSNVLGVPVVKITDIKPPYVDIENAGRVDVDKYDSKKIKKFLISKGDYLVAMTGATIGKVGRIINSQQAYLNQRVAKIDSIEGISDKKFIYYLVFSKSFIKFIQGFSAGSSVQPNISATDIGKFSVIIPPLFKQHTIAAVLSSLDDKIELLRKQNETLEALAQGLFKEWFVDFNFLNEQGKPYKKSGGKMIDTERGAIPNGWEIGRFTDIANVLSGGTPKTDIKEYWNGNIPFFTPKDAKETFYTLDTEKTITQEGLKKCNSRLFPRNIVFITARGTVGKVVLSSCDMAMNQSCYALKGKDVSNLFVFLLTKKLIENFQKVANGGVFDAIVVETFSSMEVVIPDMGMIERFETIIQPTFNKILSNSLQIQTLSVLRDRLLPKLMNGAVQVRSF